MGPFLFGMKNPGCSDCRGCYAQLNAFQHKDYPSGKEFQIEYIPVEFARDTTIQTAELNTTQENVAQYLLKSSADDAIFNTGLHDFPKATLAQYRHNLQFFTDQLSLLKNTQFIWVGTSQPQTKFVPKEYKNVYTYQSIAAYNRVAEEVVRTMPNCILSIDPTPNALVGQDFVNQYYLDTMHFRPTSSYYNSIMMQALYGIYAHMERPPPSTR